MPLFHQWIEPVKDLGVEIVGPRSVGATDHASFDNAGIPGFQFVQERLEYNSRTHHSNMDFFDRVQREDRAAGDGGGGVRVVHGELAGEAAAEGGGGNEVGIRDQG